MIPALKTGNLDLYPNSIVYEVAMSNENRATGVRYINRETKAQGEVRGKSVVVACACVQSVALLLMSKSSRYPTGLANSSGELGRNFIPHFTNGVECFLEDLIGQPTTNDEGFLDHAYVPSFVHKHKRDFARSFGIQFNYQNRRTVGWARNMPGFGKDYKEAVKARYRFLSRVLAIRRDDSQSRELRRPRSRTERQMGIATAALRRVFRQRPRKIFEAMSDWSVRILKSAGAQILSVGKHPEGNHELGGVRMGWIKKRSVLNAYCQSHDVKNLFVVDGSAFPSASEKNPTLTIMALASRTAEHISDRLKKGEL